MGIARQTKHRARHWSAFFYTSIVAATLTCVLASAWASTSAPAPKSACIWALGGPADYPVERVFPKVGRLVGPDGAIFIPRGSRAFQMWREYSAPWLPDTAFAFHYLTPDQIVLAVAAATKAGLHIDSRYESYLRLEDWLDRYWETFGTSVGSDGGNYSIFRIGDTLVFTMYDRVAHAVAVTQLLKANPHAVFVGGGTVNFVGASDDYRSWEIDIDTRRGWISEKVTPHYERDAIGDDAHDRLLAETIRRTVVNRTGVDPVIEIVDPKRPIKPAE